MIGGWWRRNCERSWSISTSVLATIFEDVTDGEHPPAEEDDPVEEETVSGSQEIHPTGGRWRSWPGG